MLPVESLTDIITFVGFFGLDAFLLASRCFADAAKSFMSNREIRNIDALEVSRRGTFSVTLKFVYDKTAEADGAEKTDVSMFDINTTLPPLLNNTTIDECKIRYCFVVGGAIVGAFGALGPSALRIRRLEVDGFVCGSVDDLRRLLKSVHSVQVRVKLP